jgi:uncharacterized protein (DUF3084 family)
MKVAILEYSDTGSTPRGAIEIPLEPPSCMQTVDVGPDSARSEPFDKDTCIVTMTSDVDCVFDVGTDPDAINSIRTMRAGREYTIVVAKDQGMKAAFKATSSTSGMGTLESLLKLVTSPNDAKAQILALSSQTAKLEAAAKKLADTAAEDKAVKADILKASKEIEASRAVVENTSAGLAAKHASIDKAAAAHDAAVEAFNAESQARTEALNQREADLNDMASDLEGKEIVLKAYDARLTAREAGLAVHEEAVAKMKADYEAKLAHLKELAG